MQKVHDLKKLFNIWYLIEKKKALTQKNTLLKTAASQRYNQSF